MSNTTNYEQDKLVQELGEMYTIKGNIAPELAVAIGTLRQLINEEFVSQGKQVSSQLIYDVLNPAITDYPTLAVFRHLSSKNTSSNESED